MGSPGFGVDHDGHLVISGPAGRGIVVCLEEPGARVEHKAHESAVLPWEAYMRSRGGGTGSPDRWTVDANVPGRAPAGIAVYVSGIFAVATHDLHLTTRGGWWQRYNRAWGVQPSSALALPIVPDASVRSCTSERATIRALFEVLKSRPDLRPRLNEENRMRQLALAMATRCLGPSFDRTGMSRDGVDITYALHAAGLVHQYGRPLPQDAIGALDQVIAQITAALARNPYRAQKATDPDVVERYVRRNYIDVKPWPFEALTC